MCTFAMQTAPQKPGHGQSGWAGRHFFGKRLSALILDEQKLSPPFAGRQQIQTSTLFCIQTSGQDVTRPTKKSGIMALLIPLKNEKSAHAETSAMRHPASRPAPPFLTPILLKRAIIRPALLLILLLSSTFSAFAYDCTVDGVYYNLNTTDKTASVIKGSYSGDIVIPETITNNDITYSVTSIGEYAFMDCIGLTSITIPNSVADIGRVAFFGCTGLTSVSIPNSVTSIGDSAFEGCSGLTSVTIPNSVTSIGRSTFSLCFGLTSVIIPSSITSIGKNAFFRCSSLTSVIIPNSVLSIGEGAFFLCTGLTSVTIGNSVSTIGDSAFDSCKELTSIVIPSSVTSIGRGVFADCEKLVHIVVASDYMTYDSRGDCNAIIASSQNELISACNNTIIPNSVTSIGESAFTYCTKLTSILIPNSVVKIGDRAFVSCNGLTSIIIPKSVTSIGNYAFDGCSGLTSVVVDKDNGRYDSRDNCNAIIETYTNKLVVGCKNTIIPNSVTTIGDGAFSRCFGLTSITIPNSVTSIGGWAFYGCTKLSSVTFNAEKCTEMGSNDYSVFYACTNLTTLTIGDKVTIIPDYAFRYCSKLTKLVSLNIVLNKFRRQRNVQRHRASQKSH